MLIPWTISKYLRMSFKDNITINIFKNCHIDIDIDIVHPYIEHPFCEMQELPVYGTSFLDEDAQTYKGIALIIAHK